MSEETESRVSWMVRDLSCKINKQSRRKYTRMEIPPCITIFDRLPRSASSLSFSELESNESFLLAWHDVVLLPPVSLSVSQ